MSIKFSCEGCGQKLEADNSDAGEFTECPVCETEIMIPEPSPALARAVSNLTLMFRPSQFQNPTAAKAIDPFSPPVARGKPLEPSSETSKASTTAEEEIAEEPLVHTPAPSLDEEIREASIEQAPDPASSRTDAVNYRKQRLQKRSLGLGPAASSKFSLQNNSKSTADIEDEILAPSLSSTDLEAGVASSSTDQIESTQEVFSPPGPTPQPSSATPVFAGDYAANSEVTQMMKRPAPTKPPHPMPSRTVAENPDSPAKAVAQEPPAAPTSPPPPPPKETFGNCPRCNAALQVPDAAVCVECGFELKPVKNVNLRVSNKDSGKLSEALFAASIIAVFAGCIWAGIALLFKVEISWMSALIGLVVGFTISMMTPRKSVMIGLSALTITFCGWFCCRALMSMSQYSSDKKIIEKLNNRDFTEDDTKYHIVYEMAGEGIISKNLFDAYANERKKIAPPERLKNELDDLKLKLEKRLKAMPQEERYNYNATVARKIHGGLSRAASFGKVLSLGDLLWLPLGLAIAYLLGHWPFTKKMD